MRVTRTLQGPLRRSRPLAMPGTVRRAPADCACPSEAVTPGRPTVAYWDIRGLAEPIRLALEHAGKEYDDVRIEAGDPQGAMRWTEEGKEMSGGYKAYWLEHQKPKVGQRVPFVNLPYMIDGDLKLAQSNTILRHIARTCDLYGPEPAVTDLVLDAAVDFDNMFTGLCYRDWSGAEGFFRDTAPAQLAQFESFAANRGAGKFVAGSDGPTVADFKLYELLRKLLLARPTSLEGYPRLQSFVSAMEELPNVKAYISSERAIVHPVNNPHAQWK
eukprot:TRINITY_DN2135_c0_g1_i2.p1 TRINITY_DN2135_c0_g1~~TRINITY_DN2135_c0_g1_i2.p1  ORF type:complete len:272 (+),score=84.13 TRINITY_DN2135_c0_g1_i2:59-874(+)